MTEKMESWSMDDLIALTDEIQTEVLEYKGKTLQVQWCELVESEEPKMVLPDDAAPSEEQTEYYKKLAGERVLCMIEKANTKEPETVSITADNWMSLPTTLRWQVSGTILGQSNENFTSG